MRTTFVAIFIACALTAGATTTNNDDSCDIGLYPAATLLLPHFEVETAKHGTDTLVTITNVGQLPQIAHVTVWTDWSFPLLSFNVFLTGYDTQSISLYDVIVNGVIGTGTTNDALLGALSFRNASNPNLEISACANLPGVLNPAVRDAVRNALVTGLHRDCGIVPVGTPMTQHPTATMAVGYLTIDVTSRCTATSTNDPAYFASEILFDNVLTGDYAILDSTSASRIYAIGSPLVHIRAVPEGGSAGSMPLSNAAATPLPYTFYGSFINGQTVGGAALPPHLDRRQPLPSTFAARFIQGGREQFNTTVIIWREGIGAPTTCSNVKGNAGSFSFPDFVRFDEHENPMTHAPGQTFPIPSAPLPSSSRTDTAFISIFPPLNSPTGDLSGWIYLNLDSGRSEQTVNRIDHPTFPPHRPSQNWVEASMTTANFATTVPATALGNGCSPASPSTEKMFDVPNITPAPAGRILVCPPGYIAPPLAKPCVGSGTNVNP